MHVLIVFPDMIYSP